MKPVLHLRASAALAGPERCLLELARPLAAEGYELELGLIERPRSASAALLAEAPERGLSVTVLPDTGRRSPAAGRGARRLAARSSVEIVHGHDPKSNRLALALARERRIPAVATVHLHTRETLVLRCHRWFDLLQLRRCAAVIAVSRAVAAELAPWLGRRRVRVVPNGLDVARFSARADSERDAAAGELAGRGQGPWIVAAGRLTRQKGFDLLLEALAGGGGPLARARLAVIGEGPQRTALERRAAAGLAGRVWLAGARRDVAGFLAAAEVVALPSRREGLPYVALEALALGRPVVASRAGGLPELIDDGTEGWLVPVGCAAPLGRALSEALASPAEAAARGARGRQRVLAAHGAEGMARGVAEVYEAVLAGRARA